MKESKPLNTVRSIIIIPKKIIDFKWNYNSITLGLESNYIGAIKLERLTNLITRFTHSTNLRNPTTSKIYQIF